MSQKQYSQTLDSEYALKRNEAIQKSITEKDTFTWQEHHDYYVKKYMQSTNLTDVEKAEYELAMLREKQGLVQPLK
jgi:hypothetical protein